MTAILLDLALPFALGGLAISAALFIHRRACRAQREAEASAAQARADAVAAALMRHAAEDAAGRAGECEPEEIIRRALDLHRQAQLLADQTVEHARRAEAAARRIGKARKEKR